MVRDRYKEVKEYHYPGATVRVHVPDLTTEERARRMRLIEEAAIDILREVAEIKRRNENAGSGKNGIGA